MFHLFLCLDEHFSGATIVLDTGLVTIVEFAFDEGHKNGQGASWQVGSNRYWRGHSGVPRAKDGARG